MTRSADAYRCGKCKHIWLEWEGMWLHRCPNDSCMARGRWHELVGETEVPDGCLFIWIDEEEVT